MKIWVYLVNRSRSRTGAATVTVIHPQTEKGQRKWFFSQCCYTANNIPDNLFHLLEPFLRKNIDIPAPLEKIARKGATRIWAVLEHRLNVTIRGIAAVNAERRSKEAQSPQVRQRTIIMESYHWRISLSASALNRRSALMAQASSLISAMSTGRRWISKTMKNTTKSTVSRGEKSLGEIWGAIKNPNESGPKQYVSSLLYGP